MSVINKKAHSEERAANQVSLTDTKHFASQGLGSNPGQYLVAIAVLVNRLHKLERQPVAVAQCVVRPQPVKQMADD